MYGAVQAIGNLDIDIIDRYQAVKRKATKTIQKCNELLNATGKGIDNGSEMSSESPWEIIPNKTPKRDNTLSQESLIPSFENKKVQWHQEEVLVCCRIVEKEVERGRNFLEL